MSMINCPECGKEISDKAKACPNCGYSFEETKFCKFCGEKIPMDSVVCTKCGRQVENQTDKGVTINNVANASSASTAQVTPAPVVVKTPKKIDKIIAIVLCICLGWCGGHKFYEGKIGMGILYLLTLGLFGIGWIVDIIIIATKPNPYYV